MRNKSALAALFMGILIGVLFCRWGRKTPPAPVPTGPGPGPTACTGLAVNPSDNLQALVNANPPGTTFCLQPGIHHDQVIPKSGDVFTGLPGAIENGGKLLTNWQRVTIKGIPYWTTPGPALLYTTQNSGICRPGYPGCYLSNRLYVNDVSYPSVLKLSGLTVGKFYFEVNGLNLITVAQGGSGYRAGDVLAVNGGGNHQGGRGSVKVTVSRGVVTGVQSPLWTTGDSYPTTPTIQTTTGGSGTGATFNVTGGGGGILGNVYMVDSDAPNTKTVEMSQFGTAFSSTSARGANPIKGVIVQNLIVEKYGSEAQGGAVWVGWYNNPAGSGYSSGWVVRNNEIRFNHSGLAVQKGADGIQVFNNNIHHNGLNEFTMSAAMNGLFSGNNFAFSNRDHVNCNFGCVFKVTGHGPAGPGDPLNAMFSHNTSHDNPGMGMWSDVVASGITYDSNTIYNNDEAGIQVEVSWKNTVTNNYLYNNGICAQGACVLGQGNYEAIFCSQCSDTTIIHNKIQLPAIAGGGWGIGIVHEIGRNSEHPAWTVPQNMHVENNQIIVPVGFPTGQSIVNMTDLQKNYSWQLPGIFVGNCYQVISLPWGASQWTQKGVSVPFASWRASGQDADNLGRVTTVCQ